MSVRERFRQVMQGEEGVRPPLVALFGPWKETLARWRSEGLVGDDWSEAAGFEDGSQHALPVNAFLCPLFEETVLSEDSQSQVVRDQYGIVKRIHLGSESMPQFLEHPLRSRGDWEALRPRLSNPDDPARFPSPGGRTFHGTDDWEQWKRDWRERDCIRFLGMLPCGFFGGLRELMGVEGALLAFHDCPDLVEEVLDTLCALWSAFYPKVLAQIDVDFVFIWEDMCYRGGPLISPATFRRFLLPRYQRLTEVLRAAGAETIMVDSDGDVTQLVPLWLEGGVTGVQPWEVASGADAVEMGRRFPQMQIIGGVDKRALAADADAIDAELARLAPLLARGRFLPAVDHGVPPDVSWSNYCYFARRLGEMLAAVGQAGEG